MRRLLVTTFNNPNVNLDEALLFKKSALDSRLLDADRMDEVPLPPELEDQKGRPGIRVATLRNTTTTLYSLMSLSQSQALAWQRLRRDQNVKFTDWLTSLYTEPVTCWIVGGHHSMHDDSNGMRPLCWGAERPGGGSTHYPYAGFGIRNLEMTWFGHQSPSGFDVVPISRARANLQHVLLLVVYGCNGIPMAPDENGVWQAEMAREWRRFLTDGARAPLILGWFNRQNMVANSHLKHAAEFFWANLLSLKNELGLGADAFDVLCTVHAVRVANAWGKACYDAYHDSTTRRALWGVAAKQKTAFTSGCGAVTPDGKIFHANFQYDGSVGRDALTQVGALP